MTQGRFRLEHLEPALEDGSETLHQTAGMASRTESGDPMDLAISESNPAVVADHLATFPALPRNVGFEHAGIWRLGITRLWPPSSPRLRLFSTSLSDF